MLLCKYVCMCCLRNGSIYQARSDSKMAKFIQHGARTNPFKTALLALLKQSPEPLSEYEIIQSLRKQFADDDVLANDSTFALFQIHFMVMNGLYQLQNELVDDGYYLSVSPLEIFVTKLADARDSAVTDGDDVRLKAYYLDWQNLERTDEEEVENLLKSFWQRYAANKHCVDADRFADACQLLGVSADDDWEVIRMSFRRLAAEHHPDKGGDPVTFIALREAYELLRCKKAYTP